MQLSVQEEKSFLGNFWSDSWESVGNNKKKELLYWCTIQLTGIILIIINTFLL